MNSGEWLLLITMWSMIGVGIYINVSEDKKEQNSSENL